MAQARKNTVKSKSGKKKKSSRASRGVTGIFSGKKKTAAGSQKSFAGERNKNAIFVLVIMMLLSAIIVLLNIIYSPKGANNQDKIIIEAKKNNDNKSDIKEKKNNAVPDISKGSEKNLADQNKLKDKYTDKSIKIYLVRYNDKTQKMSLVPVSRKIKSESAVNEAIKELIKGPNIEERRAGLLSAVPQGLRIRDIRMINKTAVIDFNGAIEENATGNILLSRIDQIVYTATQFGTVDSIMIKVNGRAKKFLGNEGLSVSGPIHRKSR